MSNRVLGLVNCFNLPELGPITKRRSIASTTFLGRYSFIDIPLSCFANSKINLIGVLCQKHIRSLSEHVTNGVQWLSNTKRGSFQVLYDEIHSKELSYSTDINCICENKKFFKKANPDYVIITSPYIIFNVDYKELLKRHIESQSRITLLYTHTRGLKNSFINQYKVEISPRGKISKFELNKGNNDEGDVSLNTYIMDYEMFENIIEYSHGASSMFNLQDTLNYLSPSVLVRAEKVTGYVRCFDSLSHYLEYSKELFDYDTYMSLFKDSKVFTNSYDTPPAYYYPTAQIKNSFIANGCKIEGKVINSIIGRNVRIGKNAVIKDSIIFSYANIAEDSCIENTIIDKDVNVLHIKELKGTSDNPIYIERGDTI